MQEDTQLMVEARAVKNGANVHVVATAMAKYANEIFLLSSGLGSEKNAEKYHVELRDLVRKLQRERLDVLRGS